MNGSVYGGGVLVAIPPVVAPRGAAIQSVACQPGDRVRAKRTGDDAPHASLGGARARAATGRVGGAGTAGDDVLPLVRAAVAQPQDRRDRLALDQPLRR